jgi:hypothetical protein
MWRFSEEQTEQLPQLFLGAAKFFERYNAEMI